ncbi:MAG: nicotinamide-nucleotide adenylyltransferase [Candidatus Altiarchaeales archaeon]|nr:nicotinamide-nucleotide adenylyltransferase [Candidatus Altiarchaeales archaeon]MBD3417189.1 nicotinamide-nucleotide adenylyltransferase [Candidatus Altiarchaeales archaeon]
MRALVIGRFQPLHIGHVKMIEYAASKAQYLIIGLGSCNKSGEAENPFTAEERETMLKESLNIETPFEIKRIPDFEDNQKWMDWIRENINFDVLMTNSESETIIFQKAGYEVKTLPYYDRYLYSSTEVRKRILEDTDWNTLLPLGTIQTLEKTNGRHRIKTLNKSELADD